jgi:hypothetical protein
MFHFSLGEVYITPGGCPGNMRKKCGRHLEIRTVVAKENGTAEASRGQNYLGQAGEAGHFAL